MEKIRILHIVPSFGIGGLEHGVAKLANGLPQEKFKVDILALFKFSGEQFSLPRQTEFIQIDLSEISSRIMKWLTIARIIRRGRYHIVHTHNWYTIYGVFAAKLALVPVVIHGEHSSYSDSAKSPFLQKIIALLPNHFIAICNPLATWMQRNWKVPKRKISYIPNGLDIQRFYPNPVKHKQDKFVFGSVGRIEEVKNFPCLINAFQIFINQYPDIYSQLMIVGDGSKRKELEKRVKEAELSDKVIFCGETRYPEEYYRKMDVYVNSTSTREGMNNCIMEAMACGLPVITADLHSNRSWLKKNENAIFFKPGDISDLVDKMTFLYANKDLRIKMGKQNPLRIQNEFTIDLFINRNKNLYMELLKKKNISIK